MEIVLGLAIYAATCTAHQINSGYCERKRTDYTDIKVGSYQECNRRARSPQAYNFIYENYSGEWVRPVCEPYTREVAMKITHYSTGI